MQKTNPGFRQFLEKSGRSRPTMRIGQDTYCDHVFGHRSETRVLEP